MGDVRGARRAEPPAHPPGTSKHLRACATPGWSGCGRRASAAGTSSTRPRWLRWTPGWSPTAGCGPAASTPQGAAMNETLRSETLRNEAGRSVLRMERRLDHPPEKVWRAVTEPARLAEWFPTTVTPDLRPGGAVGFGFGPAGAVTDLDPPRLFSPRSGSTPARPRPRLVRPVRTPAHPSGRRGVGGADRRAPARRRPRRPGRRACSRRRADALGARRGTGHGARLLLTHTGTGRDPGAALAAGRSRIESLLAAGLTRVTHTAGPCTLRATCAGPARCAWAMIGPWWRCGGPGQGTPLRCWRCSTRPAGGWQDVRSSSGR